MKTEDQKSEVTKVDKQMFSWKANFGIKVFNPTSFTKIENRGEGYSSYQGGGIQLVPFYPYIWPKSI